MSNLESTYRPLLEAVAFSARAHKGQLRKDGQTPYASHVFRVGLVLRHVFGVDDPSALTAAILHDTIEDTTTDFDDLQKNFGAAAAGWVATLSKDSRLPEPEREAAYCQAIAAAPWQVKVAKLADIFDNLMDSVHTQAPHKVFAKARGYLSALQSNLPDEARRPWEMVAQLLFELETAKN